MNSNKIIVVLLCFWFAKTNVIAQGKFAGAFKSLIGQKFTKTSELKLLKGYTFRQGDVISEVNDPDQTTVDIYQKGTTAIVFFSTMMHGDSFYQVYDVLEVKDVLKGWEMKTATCRDNGNPDVTIVALVKSTDEEVAAAVKRAWRYNRDKIRLEKISVQHIDCINGGQD
jgi:hypothetical protein